MKWFKNLNATPRLMSSFGVLIVMTIGIGYLSISNLSQSNGRVGLMYTHELLGLKSADGLARQRLAFGRQTREAIVHASEPEVVAACEKQATD